MGKRKENSGAIIQREIANAQNSRHKKGEMVKGYIAVTEKDKAIYFKEEFKGNVADIPMRFPKELGAAHPFSFEEVEKVYKKIGLINAGINKIADNVVGEFTIKAKNPNVKALLDSFIRDTEFPVVIREWVREGLAKGNGFMEIDLKKTKIRVLNANHMYVKRDAKGNVKEYNQYLGNMVTFNPESRKLTNFLPNEIAHLPVNKISGEAYGLGIIWPSERVIESMINGDLDQHKLVKRKAGAPIHVKMGQPGESVNPADIDEMSDKLKYMDNRTEWVTDGNAEIKVIDFGQVGQSLVDLINYDYRMLIAGMEVPEVMFGSGQLNEGIAKVQLESFQRKIASIQDEIEGIIEEKIFKPLLIANNLDERVEFVWNLPGEGEINARIDMIGKLLQGFNISENMKRMLHIELANLLNIKDAEEYLAQPEVGLDEQESDMEKQIRQTSLDGAKARATQSPAQSPEAKKEGKIPQPEVPGAKPGAKEEGEVQFHEQEDMIASGDISVREFVNLKEIAGFNYSDYIVKILKRLKIDNFDDLAAMNEADIEYGLLSENDIQKLRIILKDGFRRNKTIRQIENEVRSNIALKDRLDENGQLQITSEDRPNMITRTETVRLANAGLLDNFKDNGIKKVRFLAALSERTCLECESLNSQVFELNESYGRIPVHPNCRCSWISVIE